MNYPLPLRDKLRFRFGLKWAKHIPQWNELGIDAHGILFLLFVLAVYGIAGAMDYAEEKRREAEAMAQSNRALTATLADCLNGNARFLHDGPHTDGYAKTAVVCRKAEEYKL